MKLRDHPGMFYHGMSNWPPTWTRRDGSGNLQGEIGTLKYVYANDRVSNKCFLVMEHESTAFIGCLIFNDRAFCAQISTILREQTGRPIKKIGDLDLSHTL
jgi:hypothetical protein